MKRNVIRLISNHYLASVAGIVLGIAVLLVPGSAFGQDFEGSDFCQGCHEVNYRDWSASGHPYKLMKSEEARYRPIPLPLGKTWDDISYVIGGYKWKSRYIDTDGYIITVTEDEDGNPVDGMNQYNYLTGEWVNYHAGEEKKPYDCGSCHTTNWVQNENPEDLSGNQGGLPGMHGKFDAGGIHCEQCHGNGMTMEVDDSSEMCGACHYRETKPNDGLANVIPASGGFIKHHEQWNESQAGPHDNIKCVSCHNPHKRGEFSIVKECNVCHGGRVENSYMEHSMYDYDVECKDCHMPYASKSANQLGEFEGDIQTHIFFINTDPDANMFTEDGAYVALDDEGNAAVTLDFACQRCHATSELDELSRHAKNFHGEDPTVEQLEYIGMNPGLSGNWWGGHDRNGEGFMIEVAESNGALVLIGSFYTYDIAGNQIWLFAVGMADTGMTSDVTFYINKGQKWGDDFNPADVDQEEFGTGKFTFTECEVGHVEVTPNAKYADLGYSNVDYVLQRDITVSKIACPTFINNAD